MTARFYKMIVFLCVLFMVSLSGSASAWEAPKIEKPKSLANYPERPIDFICGWGVGGGADSCRVKSPISSANITASPLL